MFERSWLDGHDNFDNKSTCKKCHDVSLKRPKINEKVAGSGPFKKQSRRVWERDILIKQWQRDDIKVKTNREREKDKVHSKYEIQRINNIE